MLELNSWNEGDDRLAGTTIEVVPIRNAKAFISAKLRKRGREIATKKYKIWNNLKITSTNKWHHT